MNTSEIRGNRWRRASMSVRRIWMTSTFDSACVDAVRTRSFDRIAISPNISPGPKMASSTGSPRSPPLQIPIRPLTST